MKKPAFFLALLISAMVGVQAQGGGDKTKLNARQDNYAGSLGQQSKRNNRDRVLSQPQSDIPHSPAAKARTLRDQRQQSDEPAIRAKPLSAEALQTELKSVKEATKQLAQGFSQLSEEKRVQALTLLQSLKILAHVNDKTKSALSDLGYALVNALLEEKNPGVQELIRAVVKKLPAEDLGFNFDGLMGLAMKPKTSVQPLAPKIIPLTEDIQLLIEAGEIGGKRAIITADDGTQRDCIIEDGVSHGINAYDADGLISQADLGSKGVLAYLGINREHFYSCNLMSEFSPEHTLSGRRLTAAEKKQVNYVGKIIADQKQAMEKGTKFYNPYLTRSRKGANGQQMIERYDINGHRLMPGNAYAVIFDCVPYQRAPSPEERVVPSSTLSEDMKVIQQATRSIVYEDFGHWTVGEQRALLLDLMKVNRLKQPPAEMQEAVDRLVEALINHAVNPGTKPQIKNEIITLFRQIPMESATQALKGLAENPGHDKQKPAQNPQPSRPQPETQSKGSVLIRARNGTQNYYWIEDNTAFRGPNPGIHAYLKLGDKRMKVAQADLGNAGILDYLGIDEKAFYACDLLVPRVPTYITYSGRLVDEEEARQLAYGELPAKQQRKFFNPYQIRHKAEGMTQLYDQEGHPLKLNPQQAPEPLTIEKKVDYVWNGYHITYAKITEDVKRERARGNLRGDIIRIQKKCDDLKELLIKEYVVDDQGFNGIRAYDYTGKEISQADLGKEGILNVLGIHEKNFYECDAIRPGTLITWSGKILSPGESDGSVFEALAKKGNYNPWLSRIRNGIEQLFDLKGQPLVGLTSADPKAVALGDFIYQPISRRKNQPEAQPHSQEFSPTSEEEIKIQQVLEELRHRYQQSILWDDRTKKTQDQIVILLEQIEAYIGNGRETPLLRSIRDLMEDVRPLVLKLTTIDPDRPDVLSRVQQKLSNQGDLSARVKQHYHQTQISGKFTHIAAGGRIREFLLQDQGLNGIEAWDNYGRLSKRDLEAFGILEHLGVNPENYYGCKLRQPGKNITWSGLNIDPQDREADCWPTKPEAYRYPLGMIEERPYLKELEKQGVKFYNPFLTREKKGKEQLFDRYGKPLSEGEARKAVPLSIKACFDPNAYADQKKR